MLNLSVCHKSTKILLTTLALIISFGFFSLLTTCASTTSAIKPARKFEGMIILKSWRNGALYPRQYLLISAHMQRYLELNHGPFIAIDATGLDVANLTIGDVVIVKGRKKVINPKEMKRLDEKVFVRGQKLNVKEESRFIMYHDIVGMLSIIKAVRMEYDNYLGTYYPTQEISYIVASEIKRHRVR